MSSLFNKDIKYLKGVGDTRAALFNRLGVMSVGSLLQLYPRDYEDWSKAFSVSDAPYNVPCCIKATVATYVEEARIRSNLTIYKFKVCDGQSILTVTFFNVPFVKRQISKGDQILIRGTVKVKAGSIEMSSPSIMFPPLKMPIKPVYPQTLGLSNNQIINAINQGLSMLPKKINDPINIDIREKYKLCDLKFAIQNIHFPKNMESLEIAKRRITFDELLTLQVGMNSYKYLNAGETAQKLKNDFTNDFEQLLPFVLTDAQKRVIKECVTDMSSESFLHPMSRLIQGDVGSGKTAVCAALSYNVIKNGGQVALMAPTEILAKQHYTWFSKIFESTRIAVNLLTGSTAQREKEKILFDIKEGKTDMLIGTHSLISNNIEFQNLFLVITDEQHRFGVAQRTELGKKGKFPHMIVMSATPIPRTLSLIIHGDLDISTIDEFPSGRKTVDTFHITSDKREGAMAFIRKLIDSGEQGYIVCPLVEDSEQSNLKSVISYYNLVSSTYLKGYNVCMLHGQMRPKEKSLIMSQFIENKISVLIATTVVEVGVDVKNSTFMVIENAERFGLAQLHQLRGRVGRGDKKSYCILVSDSLNEDTVKRMRIITSTNDGFKIADEDLKLRGPGDFLGNKQHGLPEIKSLNFSCDLNLIQDVKQASQEILCEDQKLCLEKNKTLKAQIAHFFKDQKIQIH